MNDTNNGSLSRWSLIGLFVVAAFVIALGGYWVYRQQTQAIRTVKLNELKAIAGLKCKQITDWRNERIGDANVISLNPFLRSAIDRLLKSSDNATIRTGILENLELLRKFYDYEDVILADTNNGLMLSLNPALTELDVYEKRLVLRAVSSKELVFGDFFRCPACKKIYLDVASPVLDAANRPVAVVILRIDPEKNLYPLIQSWPLPSRSAETLLVRREGDNVLFLNVLRHRSEPALTIRFPLSRIDIPAVQAVLGKTGKFEGRDDSGAKTLADLRSIPGTSWFMVAKVDMSEILSEARFRGGMILILVVLGILITGVLTVLLFNNRQRKLYNRLYQTEREKRESQEEVRATLYGIGDGVIATNAAGRIRRINSVTEKLTGWTEAEALGLPLAQVFRIVSEETHEEVENPVVRVLNEGIVVGLANHTLLIARNGTEIPIADSGAPIRNDEGKITGVVLVFRDQTEERNAQNALRESEERWRSYVENAPYGVFISDEKGQYLQINPEACRMTGYGETELLSMSIPDLLAPESIEAALAGFAEMASAGEVHDEYVFITKKGERQWWSLAAVKLSDNRFLGYTNDITERKLIEESLRLKSAALDAAANAMVITDRDGTIQWINPSWTTLTGYSTEESIGRNPRMVKSGVQDAAFYKVLWDKILEGEVWRGEIINKRKDGSLYNEEGTITPIVDSKGQIIHFIGIKQDITERKRVETALWESEYQFRLIFEMASVGMAQADLRTRQWLRVNPEMCAITGYSTQEMLQMCIPDITYPEDRKGDNDAFQRVARGEMPYYHMEKRYIRKDSSLVWVNVNMTVIRDAAGKPVRSIATIEDITERKRAERKIVSSEMRYRRLFEAARDGILILDAESGKIEDVNPFLVELLGFSRENFLGKELWEIGFFKDIAESRAAFIDLQNRGYVRYDDLPLETVDGKRVEVEFVSNVYPVGEGKVVQCNIRDISERKLMEEMQTKLQKRLLQSQKMEAIGTLAGGIAHDFNNILAAIIGYAELSIQDTLEGSQIRSDLEKILQAGNRAKGVINQILIFSRQREEGKTPLNIAPIIKEVLKLLHATLPSTISVVTDIQSEIGSVIADPSQIHQVFMNFCTNAAHSMNKTGGTLTVTLKEITIDDSFAARNPGMATGRYVQLVVSDTGYGMTGDVMDRIFEPYYTTKGPGEGSGLGLSIVHGIVESMKGTINVYSEPGKGSTFKVFLPVTDQEIAVEAVQNGIVYSGQGRILFVDDEPAIVEVGARILKSLGYEVTAMTSSVDALDYFQKNHAAIDLVITDMTMPFIPGDELARDILEIHPGMPVIICTGYSDRMSVEESKILGIRHYLSKPLLKSEIAEKVHSILAQ